MARGKARKLQVPNWTEFNRKNALFAGSDEGAENWAMLASLVETCKLHGVNPEAYLSDVLSKLVNNWPNSRLAELTPWAWAAQHR